MALPGLVNAHSHSPMSLFRCFADDLKLSEWLTKHLFPAEDKLTAEDAYWGSLLSCVEMLKSGTTTFHDEYFFMEQVAQAVQDSGIRGHLAISLAEGGYNTLDKALAFAASYQGAADGRIHTGLAAHAPYTCGPEFLQQIAAAARENGYLDVYKRQQVTGAQAPTAQEIAAAISAWQGATLPEIAFYGGSFTALPVAEQAYYLDVTARAFQEGRIAGVRVSTRPDAISLEALAFLRRYNVDMVEPASYTHLLLGSLSQLAIYCSA